jgi:dihydrofolate synthase/folylpolyglutamate synthase
VHFARAGVHTAVLEVGLGGRLDSTNVCQPAVTAITSISFDHMQQLGHTLPLIAREKAGIIKPGVPVVCGVTADEPRREIEQVAEQAQARVVQLGRDIEYTYHPPHGAAAARGGGRADLRVKTAAGWREWKDVQLGLVGRHQAANAAIAAAMLVELASQGWQISDQAMRQGLAQVRWPARIELLSTRPTVILDSAHNRASIEALIETLEESFPARRRIAVFAASRDKDLAGMLAALLPKFDHVVLTRFEINPRAAGVDELADLARACGPYPFTVCPLLADVPATVAGLAGADDLVCITGSIFIAAELRPLFACWSANTAHPLAMS